MSEFGIFTVADLPTIDRDPIWARTADDPNCGVRIQWLASWQAWEIVSIETPDWHIRTASPDAAVAFVGAYLLRYGADEDVPPRDWTRTREQARRTVSGLCGTWM